MTARADQARSVVLALHYQNDVLHPDGRIALGLAGRPDLRARLIDGATRLLSAARAGRVPVVHVRIAFPAGFAGVPQNNAMFRAVVAARAMEDGSWGAAFFEGLEPRPGEPVVTHSRVNAFYGSTLTSIVDDLGAGQLYLGGIASNSVVEHTARHAADMGYDVCAVEEACACARDDLHAAAMENIRLIGQVMSIDEAGRRLEHP